MQYHQNGFKPGNPRISDAVSRSERDVLDVLIVGAGPAGLTLAAYLAQFPDIQAEIVEAKPGPMEKGQADGVSCRSMEMFQVYGFAGAVMEEAYWVNEAVFWKPAPEDPTQIIRSGRVQDVEDGLSEMPHVILNQARVHDMYLDVMANAPTRMQPIYDHRVTGLEEGDPVTVHLDGPNGPVTKRARFVVGCDGARSAVRRAIGLELKGESANKAWGVMDVLGVTDFPDIRYKALIQSAHEGTVLVIPREGGHLVRLYIELEALSVDERVRDRNISLEALISAANRILSPYSLEAKEVPWWSVYEIGQRLTDHFQKGNVFIAGDACHTHSPKAGQGMNVSMGDGFNLGWKLVQVLRGAAPRSLLDTYTMERQGVAQDLIDFDREWSRVIRERDETGDTPEFQRYFIQSGRYTAGVAVRYAPSVLTGTAEHQHRASGFEIGMRFHSAPVIRAADGKRVELGHVIKPDARWHLFAFAGAQGLTAFCDRLDPRLAAHCDLRAIYQTAHHDLDWSGVPDRLRPRVGTLALTDYERVYCPDLKTGPDIFDLRGVDRETGALVVVRPDQYVAHVLPLDGFAALAAFFAGHTL